METSPGSTPGSESLVTSRYNVAFLGPGAAAYRDALQRTLAKRVAELGDDLASLVAFLDGRQALRREPTTPIVAVYFGHLSAAPSDVDVLRDLRAAAIVIIPVVADLKQYTSHTPSELHTINGYSPPAEDADLDGLANLVLENLGLLRRARRLFISYKRTESSTEALELRHELDARGYDVFLDTHSVPRGDEFQEVLWQRMADSEVVVLLDTPGFLAGQWTREELAQAAAMTIGIVQVIWPQHTRADYTELCQPVYLEPGDLKSGGGLMPDALTRIFLAVEQLRARSVAARHNNLVREFCDAAALAQVTASVQPERYISATTPHGRVIAIPAVGVPDALRYHEASAWLSDVAGDAATVVLVYDQRGLRPKWCTFLDWLDRFLPVKTLRVTAVADRIAQL
jgi:hypothetical protein